MLICNVPWANFLTYISAVYLILIYVNWHLAHIIKKKKVAEIHKFCYTQNVSKLVQHEIFFHTKIVEQILGLMYSLMRVNWEVFFPCSTSPAFIDIDVSLVIVCDAIRQNESEVAQIVFFFFLKVFYTVILGIFNATLAGTSWKFFG